MSAVRLIVSDMDGTLVRGDKSLSDGVIAAVKRVRAAGYRFTLISARPPSGMLRIAGLLGLTCPLGAFNGGTIIRPNGEVLSADRLDPATAAETLTRLDRPGVTPWLFAHGHWYARTTDNPYVPRERRAAETEPVIRDDLSSLLDAADKIVGVSDDHALLATLEGEVAAALGARATVARSQPYYLDVTAPTGNKGDGITAIAKAIGVPLAEVMVLGDQRNDLPMFARAGLSYAMGNAPDEVRAKATRTTASNEEDGVARAIEELLGS